MSEPEISVWTVEFSEPESETNKYRYNRTATVIATSLEAALEALKERHPGATLHAAHKRSRGELIVDGILLA